MPSLQRKTKRTTEGSPTSVIRNDENMVNSHLGKSDEPVSDKIKLPMRLTDVNAINILNVLNYADITSPNVAEKSILLDVTNTSKLVHADKKISWRQDKDNFQVTKVLSSSDVDQKISAGIKGNIGALTSKTPIAMPGDRTQRNKNQQESVKCCIQRLSQQDKTLASELRSTQRKSDSATKEVSRSQQSSTAKGETTVDQRQVSKRPTMDKAEIKMQQLIISATEPSDTEYMVVPDFRAHAYGTTSTIQLHNETTAAPTASTTASTASATDNNSAPPATTSPYKDNDFSKEKGDIDIGNKLPAESSDASFIFH